MGHRIAENPISGLIFQTFSRTAGFPRDKSEIKGWFSWMCFLVHLWWTPFFLVKYRARQYKSLSPNKKTLTKNKKCWMLSGLRLADSPCTVTFHNSGSRVKQSHIEASSNRVKHSAGFMVWRLLMCFDTNTALRRNHFHNHIALRL